MGAAMFKRDLTGYCMKTSGQGNSVGSSRVELEWERNYLWDTVKLKGFIYCVNIVGYLLCEGKLMLKAEVS